MTSSSPTVRCAMGIAVLSRPHELLVVATHFDPKPVLFGNGQENPYRPATNLAILNVILAAGRGIDVQFNPLAAVRTIDGGCVEEVHGFRN